MHEAIVYLGQGFLCQNTKFKKEEEKKEGEGNM